MNPGNAVLQEDRVLRFYDCFAAERRLRSRTQASPAATRVCCVGLLYETFRNNKAARKRPCWYGSQLNAFRQPACVPGSGC
ncbi:hypothetical protein EAH72_25365 [Pseudomonas caspiana]|nr:hypothetical protein EAH72_25365 [Pseudomonas caspiana]